MKPINRKEKFLDAILTGNTEDLPVPITREETYLDEIARKPGGGGTSNYNDLNNRPQMNGVTLSGNKSTEDLIPIGSGLKFNSNGELEATGGGGVNYSTDEQVIGTWLDGKSLYQKTFSYSVGTQTGKVTIPVGTLSNVDYIVSCTGICKRGNNLQYEQIPMYDNSEWFVYTSITINDTTATVNIVENGRSAATGYVTVQYTKTTD